MFHLTVTSTDVDFRYFIFGGPAAGQDAIRSAGERFGPQGAKYTIGVTGKGYLTITDVGNTGMSFIRVVVLARTARTRSQADSNAVVNV